MSGPLTGIRVVDLTAVWFGPFAAQMLGDLGGDIIKIEPLSGDTSRGLGRARNPAMSPQFINVNRNKRAIAVDLARPEGKLILARLVRDADVFMLNLRRKPAARLGVSYRDIARVNPRIIYCACVGYGRKGTYADRPAYDDLIQGASGLAAMLGRHLGTEPRYVPAGIADKTTGLHAVVGITSALVHRARTGEGQEIEVPMFEVMSAFNLADYMYGMTFVPPTGEAGFDRTMSPHRRPYRTKDGHICALCYTDRHWQRFFQIAGRPDLAADPRYTTSEGRIASIDELYVLFSDIMQTRTSAEWVTLLSEADIPVAPLWRGEDLFDDPHLRASGLLREVDHPSEGRIRQVGFPVEFSKSPASIRRPTPRLGEHTVEVMREAGYDPAEIRALADAGVIRTRDGDIG
ncbi:MAG: CoA transferase [Alphaproteobacteria bacterium]